ncbi:hypothetical protein [Kurthia huakuii]|uniref:hypothetical protein n=1 Tax=Kurthia huakuii TaxID=1421019 RepID=UPI00049550F6|nr:hypothetical protein [Kurthia huakuii]MBM7699472.1 hypothetical protein [Kurthia huakuii]
MALVHEFGIIDDLTELGYEQLKPQCIVVDDDNILPIITSFSIMRTYTHALHHEGLGLNYYGITIIPPSSLATFLDIIMPVKQLSELSAMIIEAQRKQQYMIHFGV